MKAKFTIDKTTYEFKEITFRNYIELSKLVNFPDKGSEYKLVELLTDCPVDTLMKLKFEEWLLIWNEAIFRITNINGDANDIQPIIEFKGKKYSLPKVEDMTIGEFADLDILTSENNENKLPQIAAVLYRPVIKESKGNVEIEAYDSKTTAERAEEFLDLPITSIKSANSFFLRFVESSLKNTVDSLMTAEVMKTMPQNVQEVYQNFLQHGLGGDYSIPLLETILSDFLKQRDSHSVQRLTGYRGGKTKSKKNNLLFKKNLK
jgi:hypothetical protein